MRKINSKKGSTLSNWVFIIMFVSLIMVLIQTQILNPMNEMYGKNASIGLSEEALANIDRMGDRAGTGRDEVTGAEVTQTSDGITLIQIGSIAKGIFNTIGDFASGRFLEVLMVEQLNFPPMVPRVITILIWMSLIFIIVRIFLRGVSP